MESNLLTKQEAKRAAQRFKVISDPNKLRVLDALSRSSDSRGGVSTPQYEPIACHEAISPATKSWISGDGIFWI